jgi:2,5-dihydroxypyridine 5,6-dioxygenase
MTVSPLLISGWREVLKLSRVTAEEEVVQLLGPESAPAHVEASRLAVASLGARLVTVSLGEGQPKLGGDSTAYYGPTALNGNRAAIAALKEADFVIDLMGIYRGAEQEEILQTGTRILLVKEPPEIFLRMRPVAADRTLVKAAEARLKTARRMKVTSAAGTNLELEWGEYPCLVQYGFADEPGRWDHCPSAFIARWPNEGSSNGTVVLNCGDVIMPFKQYVRDPITLRIEAGFVRSIEGGFDARYLRDYMAMFNDPDAYAVSHLGWGLHSRAHWTGLGMYDKRQSNGLESRSFSGNFMFSTGPNAEAGGTRHTPCHLDIPMMDCSVYVDEAPVVIDGKVVTNTSKV